MEDLPAVKNSAQNSIHENVVTPLSSSYTTGYLSYSLLGFCVILLLTRIISSRNASSKTVAENGARTVPAVPYWIPLLGHLPSMGIDADGFVKSLRHRYSQGIFALNFGGATHNVMYTPGLATALLNQKIDNADSEDVSKRILQHIFGFPSNEIGLYEKAHPEIMTCYKPLLSDPGLSGMVERTVRKIKENVLSFVSFSSSLVDQTQWERKSSVKITSDKAGEQVVEASLLPLIRDFCAQSANASLMGSNFLANYPDFFDDIWTVDRGFLLLAAGLPQWLPIPVITRAHIARKNILEKVTAFHEAMDKEANGQDPGPDWRDLEDVGPVTKARMLVYRKYGFSIRSRAAIEHSLMWAANANSNTLVFWMLNRIYADPALLSRLREEIATYVKAVQPKQDFPVPEPPRIDVFNADGLCTNCPLLKSCYIESLRLDAASWSFKVVKQDFILQSREKEAHQWMLRKGDYAHAAHDLHNTDPNYFENPLVWKADRHVRYETKGESSSVDMGSIRPYGMFCCRISRIYAKCRRWRIQHVQRPLVCI